MKKLVFALTMLFLALPLSVSALNVDLSYPAYLSEGSGQGVIEYHFDSAPSKAVTASFESAGQCEFSNEGSQFSSELNLVSTAKDFFVKVRAFDDKLYEGSHDCQVTISFSSEDSNFNGQEKFSIAIGDNDPFESPETISVKSVLVSDLREGSSNLRSYRLSLSKTPEDPVFIEVISDQQCYLVINGQDGQFSAERQELKLTSNLSSEFMVQARDDQVFEGDHQCEIGFVVSTIEPDYMGYQLQSISVPVEDNDRNTNHRLNDQVNKVEVADTDLNQNGKIDSTEKNMLVFVNTVEGITQAIEAVDCQVGGSAYYQPDYFDPDYQFSLGVIELPVDCAVNAKLIYYLNGGSSSNALVSLPGVTPLDFSISKNNAGQLLTIDAAELRNPTIGFLIAKQTDQADQILSKVDQSNPNRLASTIFYSTALVLAIIAISVFLKRQDLNLFYRRKVNKTRRRPRVDVK